MADRSDKGDRALGYLKVEGNGGVPVEEVRKLLYALEESYQTVARIELEAYQLLDVLEWAERHGPSRPYWPPALGFGLLRRDGERTAPGHRLIVTQVVLQSPGFWEFLGSLSPLEVLRKYLNDRHERGKDRDYRSEAECERLAIENALGRIAVVERLAGLEREYGPGLYSSEAWRRGAEAELRPSLERLSEFDRLGLIAGATAISGSEPQELQQPRNPS